MTGSYRGKTYLFLCAVALAVAAVWLARHLLQLVGDGGNVNLIWLFLSAHLVWQLLLSWTEKPYKATMEQRWVLDTKKVSVNVPVYNEDGEIVKEVLQSLFDQTRLPNYVEVVDDGSTVDYYHVQKWAETTAINKGINLKWIRKDNGGKRSAQLHTFKSDLGADFFATLDSDSVLTPNALEEAMLPFADPKVMSVASVVLAKNASDSTVTRMTDLLFLNFQLGIRSALSRLKSVLVNSGSFAVYRAEVVRKGMKAYESETFFNRMVQFSDDSLLTLFAYLNGKTVQQPTSISYTYLPTKLSHHLRQQLRWARGSTIRSIWRFNYLPKNRIAYWEHFAAWMSFAIVCIAFVYLIIYRPTVEGNYAVLPLLFLFSTLIGYLNNMKYLTVKRSDVSFRWQLLTFAMTPLLLVWTALVLRPLRIYGMFTCRNTGWGTRKTVEVKAA